MTAAPHPPATGAPPLDLARYGARIAFAGPLDTSLASLRALQAAHIAAIPFEAMDVWLGEGVSLAPAAIEDKLLRRGRGGYCYEQNGLFQRALAQLGFTVEPRIARVLWGGEGDSAFQPRTHMALRVEAEGQPWLVDVGFGAAVPTQPLAWHSEAVQDTALGRYRLVPTGFGRQLQIESSGRWRALYEVFDEPPQPQDFEVSNWFTSTHPDSVFRRHLIAARATPAGRTTLLDAELAFRSPDGAVRRQSLNAAQLESALQDQFQLTVEPAWRARLAALAAVAAQSGDR